MMRVTNNSDFFSVVIPHFGPDDERGRKRFEYLKQCIDSIHTYADMPFEIIVHDDSGYNSFTQQLKDKISVLITNCGKNIGLADSANRAIALASSKYVLCINNDVVMSGASLRSMKNILDKKYVGFINPFGSGNVDPTPCLVSNNTRFFLSHGIASGSAIAFRKETWKEIDGWAPVHDGCSDVPFMVKFWKYGYFRACISTTTPTFRNLSQENGMIDSSIGPYDSMFPTKVFKMTDQEYEQWHQIKKQMYCLNEHKLKPEPNLLDMHFWDRTSHEIVPNSNPLDIKFDCDAAKRFGHDKWKNVMENDIVR